MPECVHSDLCQILCWSKSEWTQKLGRKMILATQSQLLPPPFPGINPHPSCPLSSLFHLPLLPLDMGMVPILPYYTNVACSMQQCSKWPSAVHTKKSFYNSGILFWCQTLHALAHSWIGFDCHLPVSSLFLGHQGGHISPTAHKGSC